MKPSPAALALAEKIMRHLCACLHPEKVNELATLIDESNRPLVEIVEAIKYCHEQDVSPGLFQSCCEALQNHQPKE